ncbi:MAG TPA: hypothetical protein VHY31_17980 [Streptosporangiaceae bacterium]|jgi:hypothetical protein|nr:hypothetical protein [Streptosporangiaceae bacterium]
MPDQLNGLNEAVSALYDAFASRSRRAEIEFDACDHCVSPEEARALARTPLHDLDGELLSTFILNASAWTWGTPDDLWYYLPRILELVAAGEFNILWNLFMVMGQRWRDWPQEQQEAMARYMSALWQAVIAGYWHPVKLTVLDVLEAAGHLGIPADSYLRAWETDATEAAALHLAWLIRKRHKPDTEWSRQVDRWLSGPGPRTLLGQALYAASTPEVAATLSAALANLD